MLELFLEPQSIKNNSRIIGQFPAIKMTDILCM